MKKNALLFILLILFVFSTDVWSEQDHITAPMTNPVIVLEPHWKETKNDVGWAGDKFIIGVNVYNLSQISVIDSMRLHLSGPNLAAMKLGKTGETLFTQFNRFDGKTSDYYDYSIDSTWVDGENPGNKLRSLSILMKKLEWASKIDSTDQPHHHFDIVVDIDSIKDTHTLIFDFELQHSDGSFWPGTMNSLTVQIVQAPVFSIQKKPDKLIQSPGATGYFNIVCTNRQATDISDMEITDRFPNIPKLDTLNAIPLPDSVIDLKYYWHIPLLKSDSSKSYKIYFENHYLRKELLRANSANYAAPKHVTNYCNAQWGAIDSSGNATISIAAEADLHPIIWELTPGITYTPGTPAIFKGVVKNIGGRGVEKAYSAKFYWSGPNSPNQRNFIDSVRFDPNDPDPFNPDFLYPTKSDSVEFQLEWNTPSIAGQYQIYMVVDSLNEIEELHDVYLAGKMAAEDSTFLYNNTNSIDVTVGIESLNVDVTHVTYQDTQIVRNAVPLQGGFPNYIFSFVHVTDQNNRFVKGLADTLSWIGANDIIPLLNRPVSAIWTPLLEYHRDDTNLPANQNIYEMTPEVFVTEVRDSVGIKNSETGVAAALVLDYSGSMQDESANLESSVQVYLDNMNPQDQTAIVKFGSSVEISQKLTSDQTLLTNALHAPPTVGGGTALYDGIYQGIAEVANAPDRKIVIVFTDGLEGSSSRSMSQVISYANRLGVAVFTVGYGFGVNESELKNIAKLTGGTYYFSSDWDGISNFYSQISYTIKNYYIVAHKTTDPNLTMEPRWHSVDIGVNYMGQATANDTGQYKVPVEGIDLWAEVFAFPDSTLSDADGNVIAKFARPGDVVSYVITYGNAGVQEAPSVSLENFLPAHFMPGYVVQVTNLSQTAQTTTDTQLDWDIGDLPPNEIRTITFDLVLPQTSPEYVVPLLDSVSIQCSGENAEYLANNHGVDQVMLLPNAITPGESIPPEILVTPEEVFALEPDTFKVFTQSPLKWWDIWIIGPDSVTDRTEYSAAITKFRNGKTPLMGNTPPLPDSALTVLPPFFDTLIPADKDTVIYRICLAYVDWFRNDTAFVYDTLLVKSNNMRPDLVPRLDRLELNKSRSPGQPIDITGTIKNIGGRALVAQDEFSTLFYYRNLSLTPDDTTHLEKQMMAGPLLSFAKDSILINTITWTPPDTGIYEIFMVADVDSQIWESHDADSTFASNNLTSQQVTVRYEPPEVQITHIMSHGTLDYLGLEKLKFHENIGSIVTVTDQNNLPIPGLASTSEWRKAGEITDVNVALESIWSPLQEFHRDDPTKPGNPDLLSSIRITEIIRTAPANQLSLQAEPDGVTAFRAKIGLLLDYSANMANFQTRAETAAKELFNQLLPEDSVMVMPFAEAYGVTQNFTNNTQTLNNLEFPQASPSTNYRLQDAIYQATTDMLNEAGRKYILVISAGGNEMSLHEQSESIEFALRTSTPVFVFNCGDDTSLAAISRGTGGKFYHLPEWGSLDAMVVDFINRLNNFYLLVHSSPDQTLDGSWRSVNLTVNYANKTGQDASHYKAPLDGFDGWIQVESQPDSVSELIKLAKAGETVHYTITYGNNGYVTGTQCQIRNVLPDSVSGLLNATMPPDQINGREVVWNVGDLISGESGAIQFDLRVNDPMPPFWFWLEDSVRLQCQNLADVNLQNNQQVDSVLVQPDEWGEPAIVANPAEVAVNEPVTLSITTQTPLKTWNVLIEYPSASAMGIDASDFNSQIQNRTEPLQPMDPDDFLEIEPEFTNTKIWDTEGIGEKRETYRAILEYTDWFDRQGTTATTFTVFAKYEMWLGQNRFNPDADPSLEISFLTVKEQSIQIKIYNVAGELVQTVFDKFTTAGQYTVTWDGRDRNNRIVGSDVYVVILEAGAYKEWRKVVVVR